MQTKKIFLKHLLLFVGVVATLSFHRAAHPFYLSVTEINISSKAKTLKLSCRPFLDDLQLALHAQSKQAINLSVATEANKKLVANYIQEHVKLKLDGKAVALTCLGYEIEEEALWCYLEAPFKPGSKSLSIENTILCSSLEGQVNIIHCIYNGQRQSTRLACPDAIGEFGLR